eukprot:TRINITY_DN25594_c0_g1_i1.p1 TRINITY_DN25594_c0_g1~~TRINITY_DN25594_c0_g1_i1.p1  ORF type:complete len:130 (+),score=26.33 TRINITY_DN25594_c0_g1_i1:84-473(+)
MRVTVIPFGRRYLLKQTARWGSCASTERLTEIETKVLSYLSTTASGKKEMSVRKQELLSAAKSLEEMRLRGGLTSEHIKQIEHLNTSMAALSAEVDFQISEYHSYTAHILEIVIIFCILLEAYIAFSKH